MSQISHDISCELVSSSDLDSHLDKLINDIYDDDDKINCSRMCFSNEPAKRLSPLHLLSSNNNSTRSASLLNEDKHFQSLSESSDSTLSINVEMKCDEFAVEHIPNLGFNNNEVISKITTDVSKHITDDNKPILNISAHVTEILEVKKSLKRKNSNEFDSDLDQNLYPSNSCTSSKLTKCKFQSDSKLEQLEKRYDKEFVYLKVETRTEVVQELISEEMESLPELSRSNKVMNKDIVSESLLKTGTDSETLASLSQVIHDTGQHKRYVGDTHVISQCESYEPFSIPEMMSLCATKVSPISLEMPILTFKNAACSQPVIYPRKFRIEETVLLENKLEKTDLNENKPEETAIIKNQPEDTEIIKNQPEETAIIKNQPEDTEIIKNQPEDTSIIKNQPEDTSIIKNQPEDTEIIKNQPEDTEIIKNQPEETAIIKNQPEDTEIIKNQPEDTSIIKNQPEDTSIIKNQPEDTSIIKNQPEDTEIIKNQPEDTSIIKNQPEDTSIIKNQPEDTSIIKNQPEDTSIIKNQPEEAAIIKNQPEETAIIKNQPEEAAIIKNQPEQTVIIEIKPEETAFNINLPDQTVVNGHGSDNTSNDLNTKFVTNVSDIPSCEMAHVDDELPTPPLSTTAHFNSELPDRSEYLTQIELLAIPNNLNTETHLQNFNDMSEAKPSINVEKECDETEVVQCLLNRGCKNADIIATNVSKQTIDVEPILNVAGTNFDRLVTVTHETLSQLSVSHTQINEINETSVCEISTKDTVQYKSTSISNISELCGHQNNKYTIGSICDCEYEEMPRSPQMLMNMDGIQCLLPSDDHTVPQFNEVLVDKIECAIGNVESSLAINNINHICCEETKKILSNEAGSQCCHSAVLNSNSLENCKTNLSWPSLKSACTSHCPDSVRVSIAISSKLDDDDFITSSTEQTGNSPNRVADKQVLSYLSSEISTVDFEDNTSNEVHTVPEVKLLNEDVCLNEISLYSNLPENKQCELLCKQQTKPAFKWNSVYETILNKSLTDQATEDSSFECLSSIVPICQSQRPRRFGLSRKQNVRHLHDKP